jgi:uncharacterized membrane protein YebE (DUF533 family)
MAKEHRAKLLSNNSPLTGLLGGAAGGALITAFANKKSARKLLKAGGLVALGGVAWHAYRSYKDGAGKDDVETAALPKERFDEVAAGTDADSTLLVQAMIAAAHADGHLDDSERERIWRLAMEQGSSPEELATLGYQIQHPWTIDQLAEAADSFELKMEIYTVSLVILEGNTTCDGYLDTLAQKLALPRGLVLTLNRQFEGDRIEAA